MTPERRSSFRAPVHGHVQVEIVCGKTRIPVDLIDESAGGLLVASRQRPGVREGDVVQVRLGDHRVEARVAHVQRRGLGARIGLERITESAIDADGNTQSEGGMKRLGPKPWRTIAIVVGAVAILVIASGVVLYNTPSARQDLHRLSTLLQGGGQHGNSSGALSSKRLPRLLKQQIRQHHGLDVFGVAGVADELHLSPSQQAHIDAVAEQARVAANELGLEDAFGTAAANHPEFQQTLARLQVEALSVLDPLQRRRLEDLLEQSISGSELLQRVSQHYWPQASASELFEKLGAAALTLPRVAEQLQITEAQRGEIKQLVDDALDASEELAALSPGETQTEDPAAQARALLEDVRQQVLEMLSEEQKAQLMPESAASAGLQ